MRILQLAEDHLPEIGNAVPKAKHMVAYFGLLTDTIRLEGHIKDKPYWIVCLGGVKILTKGGPVGGPGTMPGTMSVIGFLDAETGKPHLSFVLEGPVKERGKQ